MASKRQTEEQAGRYEFRVWGRHRRAARMLGDIADRTARERVDDCYLLVADSTWNAKIRGDSLKIKRLIEERKGFEQWASTRHGSVETAPSPFDELVGDLGGTGAPDFAAVVARARKVDGVRVVIVRKDRHRYWIGDLRAESTRIRLQVSGDTLRTLVIEGDDLAALTALRKRLGLRGEDNVPVHDALAAELDS